MSKQHSTFSRGLAWVTCFWLTLSMSMAPAITQSQGQIGVSAAVRGGVQVQSAGTVRTPVGGEAMLLGDRVRTGTQSGMQILLLDESVFTIGESNDLVIDRFVYDPERSTGEIAARATQGFFRFVSGGVGAVAPQNIELNTPSATIGVRGTSVDVVVGQAAVDLARSMGLILPGMTIDPLTAVMIVFRGPAVSYGGITQRGRVRVETPAGSVEIRTEGFGVFVPFAGARPQGPFVVPQTINERVISSIELPEAGTSQTVGGVEITDLPTIDPFGNGGLIPNPGGLNPDLTGPGFNPCAEDRKRMFMDDGYGEDYYEGEGSILRDNFNRYALVLKPMPKGGSTDPDPCRGFD